MVIHTVLRRVIAVDANVLINLIHVEALHLLGELKEIDFVVVDEVIEEITRPEQAASLADAISAGWVRRARLEGTAVLEIFAELIAVLGKGESATLAWAACENVSIACDDRRVRREADARLGIGRILTTPGILLLAIRAGLLTVGEADGMKAALEANRFRMAFGSFSELMP